MGEDSLTIIDNRTGKQYKIPIKNGAIKATDLFQIKVTEDDGLVSYDPGFMNTASCQSKITYIDGDRGILRYRGAVDDVTFRQRIPTQNYLYHAVEAVLAGARPKQTETPAYGCAIVHFAL